MDIDFLYNRDLAPLEGLLQGVQRAGDFAVRGTLEIAMPRVEVDGVGILSFPVPQAQVGELIGEAERAPYGRGGATILDTSVRKVWQVAPDKVSIGGKSWQHSLEQVLSTVAEGLGCAGVRVSAELYKLLVYDEGGFFKAHRDTEKTDGMFGTLVIVLPSSHGGGELVVRHAGREVVLNLSGGDVSELTFAAFYSDCEHEVRRITAGNRVCLVYNLIQQRGGPGRHAPLTAPLYDAEVIGAAEIIERTFAGVGAPGKLAWLLKHQYSPAGLSFNGLKGEDAARVQVLQRAAERAQCAFHLGLVHLQESGSAESYYDPYYDRHSRWNRYDEERDEEDVSSSDYEVIEIIDSIQYLDQWVSHENRAVDFGPIPLEEGEALPAGALDDEEPDEQRLMEATGNEGATFERSYRRAAAVIWPLDRFADVLLQAGVGAVLPYLEGRVRECVASSASETQRERVVSLAGRITAAWHESSGYLEYGFRPKEGDRGQMITLLGRLGDAALLERFVGQVVPRDYDGSENEALATNVRMLGPRKVGELLSNVACENMPRLHNECVNLLSRLVDEHGREEGWTPALWEVAAAIVDALPDLLTRPDAGVLGDWRRFHEAKAVDSAMVAGLLDTLAALDAKSLRDTASAAIAGNVDAFDPRTVVVPALESLRQLQGDRSHEDTDFARLWQHAAEFLLARSEFPPEPPKDWAQEVTLSCGCQDCRELQAFAQDPAEQVHRFRVRTDRRAHLHNTIKSKGLDMTHVTERKGSPYTLVCTKTLRTFEKQCGQQSEDVAALTRLSELVSAEAGAFSVHVERIAAANRRAPRPFSPT